jgi:valyl-tRNA synthetase
MAKKKPKKEPSKFAYNPLEVEGRWTRFWFDNNLFDSKFVPGRPNFSIPLPPPNITGDLHMGHALNGTLQDILIRVMRMRGYNVLWQPGTDHAGISAQMVVERQLKAEGKNRHDMGRDQFIARVWDWKRQNGDAIYNQYKHLGVSFAWDRRAFTMDPEYARAVTHAFVSLYKDGYIYRGKRITNWCPRCLTSLSDLEVQHEEVEGAMYLINYPLGDGSGASLTIATTRPQTMFGDAAIAVHPKDERYAHLVGKNVLIPLSGRQIPIIADHCVERDFGTGALKITPAHNPIDYDVGQRHNLPSHMVLNEEGGFLACDLVPSQFHGVRRDSTRQAVCDELKALGFLIETREHKHNVGHCERCNTPIEPILSDQWYLRMADLAQLASKAIEEGEVRFVPDRYGHTALEWLGKVRDWNISRQLWWGHQIPIWTCDNGHVDAFETAPAKCPTCGSPHLEQDADVLDTWFSSALWPFATLGWPEETQLLADFYPTAALSTAREIINLWVLRMMFMSLKFLGKIPFKDVLIHPVVQTPDGKRMSKSKGNAIDPLEMILKYGTDATRMYFANMGIKGDQDSRFFEKRIEEYKKFANKLYQAGRFVLGALEPSLPSGSSAPAQLDGNVPAAIDPKQLTLADRWILHRYHGMLGRINRGFDNYDFHEIARELYEFAWGDFCDWYIEIAKTQIAEKPDGQTRNILYSVFEGLVRALHPIMPFVTEELWSQLPKSGDAGTLPSIMFAPYPVADETFLDGQSDTAMSLLIRCVDSIRKMRMMNKVTSEAAIDFVVEDGAEMEILRSGSPYIQRLAWASSISIRSQGEAPENAASAVVSSIKIFMPLDGVIDIEKTREDLLRRRPAIEVEIAKVRRILDNPSFKANAPADKVEKVTAALAELEAQLADIDGQLSALG